ncbi:MAG: 50S ribosomal protein L32 [Anaerolineae bacterium]
MGAVPKHRITSRRRRNRRAQTWAPPDLPNLIPCPECGELKRAYHVCKHCGTYRRMQVIEVEE